MDFFNLFFLFFFNPRPRTFFSLLLEIEEGKSGEREKHRLVATLYEPRPGIKSTTWVPTRTGNQTCNLLISGTTLQPTESQWPGQDR